MNDERINVLAREAVGNINKFVNVWDTEKGKAEVIIADAIRVALTEANEARKIDNGP